MDTATHALLGALVTRAVSASATGTSPTRHGWIGAVAAAFPDIDYLTYWIDPLAFLAQWHRGPTHSLVLLPLWATLLGALLAWMFAVPRTAAIALAALAIASHIGADLLTSYGVHLLAPLSNWHPALDFSFVVDALFTGVVILGLLASARWRPQAGASVGLLVLVLYIATQAWLKSAAETLALIHAPTPTTAEHAFHALPMAPLPVYWKVITVRDEYYAEAYLVLMPALHERLRRLPGVAALIRPYQAPSRLVWREHVTPPASPSAAVRQVWRHPEMAPFRRFARYPVVYRDELRGAQRCVWFTDLRYVFPGLPPPFRYGMCRHSHSQAWHPYRLRWFTVDARVPLNSRDERNPILQKGFDPH
ncbi:MAG: metal-dependent hydrolase [Nitrococcus mobilis]|nr:metal-dependent hydrolase [Nitrococcus mobilis]